MNYDIVIATRNRLSILQISLPLFIKQTREANSIIIVDSSDDHNQVKTVCESIIKRVNPKIRSTIIRSGAGSSHQRNAGLRFSNAGIIFFPDDDSLWYPDYAENIMEIYEMDKFEVIGGIQGSAVKSPPDKAFDTKTRTHKLRFKDKLSVQLSTIKKHINLDLFKDPIFIEGFSKQEHFQIPEWLFQDIAIPSGPMTGFAMSFRADMIKQFRFDENLGTYSLFEDRDASLNVMQNKMILTAMKAKVYHYRAPERRANGREWGMMHILNRTYVICKHSEMKSKSRKALKAYLIYKIFRYLLQATDSYGIQCLIGAMRAFFQVDKLMRSDKDKLPSTFAAAKANCTKNNEELRTISVSTE